MTIYTNTPGDGSVIATNYAGGAFCVRRRIDLAVEAALAGVSAFSAADVLAFLDIPAGTIVDRVAVKVLEAEGGTLTADIGDGTDPDGFVDGVDLNAVAYTDGVRGLVEATPNTFVGYSFGKLYTANDTLDLTINNNTAETAVFDVFVWGRSMSLTPGVTS